MINYEPFWTTMEKRGLTAYQLIYYWGISSNTLRRMRHNEAISTPTLNELCLILDCSVEDILKFEASEEEQEELIRLLTKMKDQAAIQLENRRNRA